MLPDVIMLYGRPSEGYGWLAAHNGHNGRGDGDTDVRRSMDAALQEAADDLRRLGAEDGVPVLVFHPDGRRTATTALARPMPPARSLPWAAAPKPQELPNKIIPPGTTYCMVYGNFEEPTHRQNSIIVRYPDGPIPWRAKIAPAIDRLLRPWFRPEDRRGRNGMPKQAFWAVDQKLEPVAAGRVWDSGKFRRYEWAGTELREVV